jgi:hypothetical protein
MTGEPKKEMLEKYKNRQKRVKGRKKTIERRCKLRQECLKITTKRKKSGRSKEERKQYKNGRIHFQRQTIQILGSM